MKVGAVAIILLSAVQIPFARSEFPACLAVRDLPRDVKSKFGNSAPPWEYYFPSKTGAVSGNATFFSNTTSAPATITYNPYTVYFDKSNRVRWNWTTWGIERTGSGTKYASQCLNARRSWVILTQAGNNWPSTSWRGGMVYSAYYHLTSTTKLFDTYVSCGITRARSHEVVTWTRSAVGMTYVSANERIKKDECGRYDREITEVCSFPVTDCNSLWKGWVSGSRSAETNTITAYPLSLASPPTIAVFNGTTLRLVNGTMTAYPTISFLGIRYPPRTADSFTATNSSSIPEIKDIFYEIQWYYNTLRLKDTVTIRPGQQVSLALFENVPNMPECDGDLVDGFWGGPCTIIASEVQLLYFPVTVTRNMCGTSRTDNPLESWVTSHIRSDSAPDANKSPVVVNGTTFDMRSVYISFGSMSAYAGRRQGRVGYPHSGGVIAIPSSEVYSVGWWTKTHREPADVNTAYFSFNFADLNFPLPAPAYFANTYYEEMVRGNNCCNIVPDSGYFPTIALPPRLRDADPAWATCELPLWGMYDPPIALPRVTQIADLQPTGASPLFTVRPSPGAMAMSMGAERTNAPVVPSSPGPPPQPWPASSADGARGYTPGTQDPGGIDWIPAEGGAAGGALGQAPGRGFGGVEPQGNIPDPALRNPGSNLIGLIFGLIQSIARPPNMDGGYAQPTNSKSFGETPSVSNQGTVPPRVQPTGKGSTAPKGYGARGFEVPGLATYIWIIGVLYLQS